MKFLGKNGAAIPSHLPNLLVAPRHFLPLPKTYTCKYPPTRSLTMPLPKYIVRLTADERAQLDDLIRTGKRAGWAGTMGRLPRQWSVAPRRCTGYARRSWRRDCRRPYSGRNPPVASIARSTESKRPT